MERSATFVSMDTRVAEVLLERSDLGRSPRLELPRRNAGFYSVLASGDRSSRSRPYMTAPCHAPRTNPRPRMTPDLAESVRSRLLVDAESILRNRFTNGTMAVPYQTRLWDGTAGVTTSS
jgi:hypothetical protein